MRPTQRALSSGKLRRGWRGRTAASQRARFQAVCVASSWLRQNGVVSSRPPAGNARRWAFFRKELTNAEFKTGKDYVEVSAHLGCFGCNGHRRVHR